MSRKRRKEIKRHLTEDELDEKLAEADNGEIIRVSRSSKTSIRAI